jgi:hypothetical protein
MTPASFVQALAAIRLPNVFNPYAEQCDVHDRANAPALRRRALRTYLEAVIALGSDTIWMGRDLGYRGGRRTGLALTDEAHLPLFARIYPGSDVAKATHGAVVAERTAAEIWGVLSQLDVPPLLWNVFPFHPHEPEQPFTNRKFTGQELRTVDELNGELVQMLGIHRIIAIGQDAASYATQFGAPIECVRHPSYGGVTEFRTGICRLYKLAQITPRSVAQPALF